MTRESRQQRGRKYGTAITGPDTPSEVKKQLAQNEAQQPNRLLVLIGLLCIAFAFVCVVGMLIANYGNDDDKSAIALPGGISMTGNAFFIMAFAFVSAGIVSIVLSKQLYIDVSRAKK